eukprot:RCo018449
MPKKISANPKAVEARERKQAAKDEAHERQRKQKEDAEWAETDKKALKSLQRQKDIESARQSKLQRSAELKKLEEEEKATLGGKAEVPARMTLYQIQQGMSSAKKSSKEAVVALPMENPNRVGGDVELATGLDQALSLMDSATVGSDKHPEKRLAAAHREFEEKTLPLLKTQFPSLKLSQLKEMAWKMWQKDPSNPAVQAQRARSLGASSSTGTSDSAQQSSSSSG